LGIKRLTKTKGYYEKQCPKCGAVRKDNQLGLEETPEEFVNNLVEVFREVKRVLRDDGTVWLNLGDSYSSGGRTTTTNQTLRGDKNYGVTRPKPSKGIKPKDLIGIGIPWRVAFALQADGWYLRQDIIWHKPNPMPESVKDRCTKAHEYIFLLSKSVKYYFDNEAIKEDSIYAPDKTHEVEREKGYYKGKWSNPEKGSRHDGSFKAIREKRNKRSVWTIATKPFKGAHFATFPPDLIKPCVLAGCPEGGTVLDPFGGSGTTALLANGHNRNAILCELNEEYIKIAKERLAPDGDLFTDIEVII
jgi:site-specific DNA-methyltransferase (adenine-specific)